MLKKISKDFKVSLVSQDEESPLFAARRSDVWHFVVATRVPEPGRLQNVEISQFHYPRYGVARALAAPDGISCPAWVKGLGIHADSDGVTVSLHGKPYHLPENLVADMRRDLPILERASAVLKTTNEGIVVPSAVTPSGHPVITEHRCLAAAISFERDTRGRLDAGEFGVYSAYCSWRDFIRDDPSRPETIAIGMAEEMANWDPKMIWDDVYWESSLAIQDCLWQTRLWGPGVAVREDALREAFLHAFEQLSPIQFTQFMLMNGMHRGGPFHALAALFGILSFDDYKDWRTRGLESDSLQEQEIRTQSSFIELFGISDPETQK